MLAQSPVRYHLDLYSYWLSKRGFRRMPARSDLNPAAKVSGLGAARDHTRVGDRLQVGSDSGGPDLTRREANI